MANQKTRIVKYQKPMVQVVGSLIPLLLAGVYFFGWRTLVVLFVVNVFGFLAEYIFARVYKQQVSSAVFVTCFLFSLSLPPTIPLWIAAVGIVFGVVFGKMVFGGFGKNVFNPAISGRAFIYVSFGVPMTSRFVAPAAGFPGGFGLWLSGADAVTKATPLVLLAQGKPVPLLDLFLGNTAGSIGETSALLIIICGLYLLIKKVASYRIVVGGLLGFGVLETALWLAGVPQVPDPVSGILSGSFLFCMMFMATDPVSASQTTDTGRWIYGALIGVLVGIIRNFSVWPEGLTFAILLGNMFAPLLDYLLKEGKAKKAGVA